MTVRLDTHAWFSGADVTPERLAWAREHFSIQPRGYGTDVPEPLILHRERDGELGLPRAWFEANIASRYPVEDHTVLGSPLPSPLAFNGALFPLQVEALAAVQAAYARGLHGVLVEAAPGFGKCLGVGTPVLRFDGGVVPVETIRAGDLLMGPDSTPRRVLSTTRDVGPLYRVVPLKGAPWVCNDAHILSLVNSRTNAVRDMAVSEWVAMSPAQQRVWKQYAPEGGVVFPDTPAPPVDPYFLGVWYGDGTKSLTKVAVSKPDAEIAALCEATAAAWGLRVRREMSTGLHPCPTYHLVGDRGQKNPLLDALRGVVGDGVHLPTACVRGSRAVRRAFLAGILDADGYYNTCYEVILKHREWVDDLAYLARSLGYAARVTPKVVSGTTYWRLILSGDFTDLPVRIPRKKPQIRRQIKKVTRTGITVESAGVGEYAGFELDGDGRFLLGDFTVTHNTVLACAVVAALQVKTLVMVHKGFLARQWERRIAQYLPGAKVGMWQGPKAKLEGCHIVIGLVQTVVRRDDANAHEFGLVVTDECFPAGTEVAVPGGVRPIESLRPGDRVLNATGVGTVAEVQRRRVPWSRLVRVEFEGGREVVCTANHPFLTRGGWVPAAELAGEEVWTWGGCSDTMLRYGDSQPDAAALRDVSSPEVRAEGSPVLLSCVCGGWETAGRAVPTVSAVRGGACEACAVALLHAVVSAESTPGSSGVPGRGVGCAGDGVPPHPSRDGAEGGSADACVEPDGGPGSSREGVECPAREGAQTPIPRGEGETDGRAPAGASGVAGIPVGVRVLPADRAKGSHLLRSGSRLGGYAESHRGGRWIASSAPQAGGGSAQGCFSPRLRVVRVESVEPRGASGSPGGSPPDPGVVVYNLSVDGHPSYVVGDMGVVVHNCHRVGAHDWSPAASKFPARHALGLSATFRRKDGAERVFLDQIGGIVFSSKRARQIPTIHFPESDFRCSPRADRVRQITALVKHRKRNQMIVGHVLQALRAGRKVLVMSERREHLTELQEAVAANILPTEGFRLGQYVGGMTEEELAVSERCNAIFATLQNVSEGLDIADLDTLLLTTPITDPEQAGGRVLRPHPAKKPPLIVDYQDPQVGAMRGYARKRREWYQTLGWTTAGSP